MAKTHVGCKLTELLAIEGWTIVCFYCPGVTEQRKDLVHHWFDSVFRCGVHNFNYGVPVIVIYDN